jgi:prevent-host-death family protein
MSQKYSIAEARDRFAKIVRDVEKGKPIEITRRGKPVAVVISQSEYQRLTSQQEGFGKTLREFRQKYRIDTLNIDPDEVFSTVRDRTMGREVSF